MQVKRRSKKPSFRFIDLFAGIGGTRLALESVGGKCVFSSEIDKDAVKTYFANFGDVPFGDILQVTPKEIPSFDLLCAGFPCQPFSSIGRREGFLHATQGTMFHEVLRIARAKKPKVLLLENVPGLVTHEHGKTLTTIILSLEAEGYRITYKILDAADFGVPQRRKRFYLVAMREDLVRPFYSFNWPSSSGTKPSLEGIIESGVEGYEISKHLQRTYINKAADGRPQVITRENASSEIAGTLVASYHKIQRLTGTFVADGPTGLRLLTIEECKAIMGFPSEFVLPVSRTQAYRQLGNSVAIPVVREIADAIVRSMKVSR